MMGEDLNFFIFIGIGFAMIFVFIFLYVRDSETNKKLALFERSIDNIEKQLHKLQKKLKEQELESEDPSRNIELVVKQQIRSEMENASVSLFENLETLKEELEHFKEQIDDKMAVMDERVKETSYPLPSSINNLDEGRIIQMFRDGWSIDSIAKELSIPKGEVEFTLKLTNLQ